MKTAGIVMTLGLSLAGAAHAAGPKPGEYATQPGGATLVVTQGKGGLRFALDAVGTNAHTCTLAGSLRGDEARTDPEDDGASICRIGMAAQGDAIEVTPRDERCREYCGLRAGFEGRYVRVPPGCSVTGRERRNQAFLADYRAKRYAAALGTLRQTEAACGKFFDWAEKDAFANDKALTLHRLGRNQECLAALDDTLVADNRNEAELREDFWPAPTDWDIYLPIAKANWHNRKLCTAAPAAKR